jgi:hypothetical protein
MSNVVTPPILDNKRASSKSLFTPAALLREARRQKGLVDAPAPSVCIFDPDGDLARRLRQTGASKPFAAWPCYHTDLDTFELGGRRVGVIGRVVGAAFAVLVARGAVRQRMRSPGQPDLGGADHALRPAALFCGDRPRLAG